MINTVYKLYTSLYSTTVPLVELNIFVRLFVI